MTGAPLDSAALRAATLGVSGFFDIQASFADRRYGRISQKAHPGWSRVYARVLAPGVVRAGDPVRLARPPA